MEGHAIGCISIDGCVRVAHLMIGCYFAFEEVLQSFQGVKEACMFHSLLPHRVVVGCQTPRHPAKEIQYVKHVKIQVD